MVTKSAVMKMLVTPAIPSRPAAIVSSGSDPATNVAGPPTASPTENLAALGFGVGATSPHSASRLIRCLHRSEWMSGARSPTWWSWMARCCAGAKRRRARPQESGVIEAVESVGGSSAGMFLHGTTVGTNALLEGRGAKVALVTSAGFEDLIEIVNPSGPTFPLRHPSRPPSTVGGASDALRAWR